MLNLTRVEQFAWNELRGDAEESTQETADGSETAGELGVVSRVRIFDAGVNDGADAGTDPDPDNGSDDHRSSCVAGPDELNFSLRQREGAINSGFSLVADQSVVIRRVESTHDPFVGQLDSDVGAGLQGLYALPLICRLLRHSHCGRSQEQGKAEHKVQRVKANFPPPQLR